MQDPTYLDVARDPYNRDVNKASALDKNKTPTMNVNKDAPGFTWMDLAALDAPYLGTPYLDHHYFDWSDPVLRLFGEYSIL